MTFRDFIEKIVYYGLESIGKYYSSYRGYVVDKDDPDNMGRILVQVPVIARGKTISIWAWPKHVFSGSGYGIQVLPPKGDMVWVEFESGNSSSPMWFHGHFALDEKPEEFASPQVYGFKSPKGQIIIIDDRDDVEKIIINHGENAGLVKVIELTEMMNKNEQKINEFLAHYRVHQIVDPLSGIAGPLTPLPLAPLDVAETEQVYIENEDVQH